MFLSSSNSDFLFRRSASANSGILFEICHQRLPIALAASLRIEFPSSERSGNIASGILGSSDVSSSRSAAIRVSGSGFFSCARNASMGSPLDCDAAQAIVDATKVQHTLAIISLHLTRRILPLLLSTRQ